MPKTKDKKLALKKQKQKRKVINKKVTRAKVKPTLLRRQKPTKVKAKPPLVPRQKSSVLKPGMNVILPREGAPTEPAGLRGRLLPTRKVPRALPGEVPLKKEPLIQKPVAQVVLPKKEAVIPPKPALVEKPSMPRQVTRREIPAKPPLPPPVKEEKIEQVAPVVSEIRELELKFPITAKDLAIKLQEKPSLLIKHLMEMGMMVAINQPLDEAAVAKICEKYKCKIKPAPDEEELVLAIYQTQDAQEDLRLRPPIVTFMGHVDHGKTSLLDAIRKTKVAESEHGGITQHIGAYRVALPDGEITFLDTPGHEAFTAMRARGASVTDIVVLVVAADDGIMPQTEEAIDHARAAGVPIIVAINKIDKPQADIDRTKKQLAAHELNPEDWGGKTITVSVSAKTGEGINNLLEMILLEAEMLELKSNPARLARGVVVEAKMCKGKGPVATLLVKNGSLHLNENIIVGSYFGKIRAMYNDHGLSVTSAGPAIPVEVLGISGIPEAGEQFYVLEDERQAKELASRRLEKEKEKQLRVVKRMNLEELHSQIAQGKVKELKLIIKADVQGSLEAIKDTLNKLHISEIKLELIHSGVGNVNTSDVVLAIASDALIVGFNVSADERAKELIAKEGIDLRTYNIIYELASDIKAAIEGMLEPKIKKVFLGRAEVRKVFKLSKAGTVAGCMVTKGRFNRNSLVTLVRNGQAIFEGKLSSLKRFKDDVRDVSEGFECGMSLAGFDQYMEGDIIEAYEVEKIARKL